MKILVVDDNLMTRSLMKDLLTEMGHEITGEAGDGNEAVEAFRLQKPELVLMDLIMPVKTGLEALQEIRALDPAARVVMVTAVEQGPISGELMEKGAAGILHKPFLYGELQEILKKIQ